MNKILSNFISLTIGITIGAIATNKFLEAKYAEVAEKEIDSIRNFYMEKTKDLTESTEVEHKFTNDETKKELTDYKNIIKENNYNKNSDKKEATDKMNDTPYVISPEEFDDDEDFDVVTLLYFEDGVVTDEQYNSIDNYDKYIGEESLEHFGDYPDDEDTVFVRNESTKTNYEILRQPGRFSDI